VASGEAIDIDVPDTRLTDDGIEWYCEWTKGGDPNRRLLVDGNTPLDQFLATLKSRVGGNRIGVLSILAHGWGEWEYQDKEKKRPKTIHGGFGVEFCKDTIPGIEPGVTLQTVDRFKELYGLFSSREVGIKLKGCEAAAEYRFRVAPNSSEFKTGFGKKLCGRLATVTGASVMASDHLQDVKIDDTARTYRWANDIRTIKSCVSFGEWEGSVWIFRPDGTIDKIKR